MSELVSKRIRRLIELYERGAITKLELSNTIADCAIEPEFFDHLAIVPHDVICELHKIAEHAPAHPEDCCVVQSINADSGFDYEAHDRAKRETAYWAAQRLREYFFPNQPPAKFEPIKLIGIVDDAIEMDKTVVIFGVEQGYLIRKNPIHLIVPNRGKIVTFSTGMGFIKACRDNDSVDPFTKRYGSLGIFLDRNVISSSETPPTTEVWVDRSAVAELPTRPYSRSSDEGSSCLKD